MTDDTLTTEKLERIIRVRTRYLARLPVPASDLHALGMSPDVASAKYVIGIYLDPSRPPTVEGSIGGSRFFGVIVSADVS